MHHLTFTITLFCGLWFLSQAYVYDDGTKHHYNTDYYDNSYTGDIYNYDDYSSPSSYYDQYYGASKLRRGRGRQNTRSNMLRAQKSYAHMSSPKPQTKKVFVPVVIKKKAQKKQKILSVHTGFYVPGGTQMFGKFKDLFSCKKACEITPTCFSGDFNPWLGKCYLHSNLTACSSMRAHKSVTHFKKVPCEVLETTRGYVVLGVSTINGIEIKGITSLADCIKKCATAGGGVAEKDSLILADGHVCCHIDYDFGTHKCYFHACIDQANAQANICYAKDTLNDPPKNSIANPTSVSVTICPRSSD